MNLKKLITCVADENTKSTLILSMSLAVLQAVLFASIPAISLYVLYLLFTDPQNDQILWISLSTLIVTILRVPVLSQQTSISYKIAFELGEKLREYFINHLQNLSLGTVRKQKSGRLVGLFNDDVKWVEAFIGGGTGIAIGALAVPLLLLIIVYVINVKLALILTLALMIGLPAIYIYNRIMVTSVRDRAGYVADLSSRVGEHFAGMSVLRAFSAVGLKDASFRHDLEKLISAYKAATWKMTPLSVLGLFLMEVGIVFAAYFGMQDVINHEIESYIVIFVLFAALSLYNPLLLFLAGSGQYRLAETASVNANEFLALPVQETDKVDLPAISDDGVSFKDVNFSYGDGKVAVSDISFTAEAGKVTAIVGPSGAGKSTLFNLIARFWDPESGEIKVGGRNVRHIPTDDLSKHLAIVTQETVLINESLERNIDLGLTGYQPAQIREAASLARCTDFIEDHPDGYQAQIGEDGVSLSGGQRQRITIARALLRDAPIVLLDEATSSIDPVNARLIHESISVLTQKKTVLVIAHRLSSIMDADKIIVMDQGRIVAEGTHEMLLDDCAVYQQLWQDHQSSKRWRLATEA